MNDIFVDEIQKHPEMTPSDILNWYRNLYCKVEENEDASKSIMVKAINDYFMTVRDAINELKQQHNWASHRHIVEAIAILTENNMERWKI